MEERKFRRFLPFLCGRKVNFHIFLDSFFSSIPTFANMPKSTPAKDRNDLNRFVCALLSVCLGGMKRRSKLFVRMGQGLHFGT